MVRETPGGPEAALAAALAPDDWPLKETARRQKENRQWIERWNTGPSTAANVGDALVDPP
jgi:hypothetical protein